MVIDGPSCRILRPLPDDVVCFVSPSTESQNENQMIWKDALDRVRLMSKLTVHHDETRSHAYARVKIGYPIYPKVASCST